VTAVWPSDVCAIPNRSGATCKDCLLVAFAEVDIAAALLDSGGICNCGGSAGTDVGVAGTGVGVASRGEVTVVDDGTVMTARVVATSAGVSILGKRTRGILNAM